jgi:hypothetical protein
MIVMQIGSRMAHANGVEQFTVREAGYFLGDARKKIVMIAPYIEQSKLER